MPSHLQCLLGKSFGRNLAGIWPEFGRNSAGIWPEFGRNLAGIWPGFGQSSANNQFTFGWNLAGIWPPLGSAKRFLRKYIAGDASIHEVGGGRIFGRRPNIWLLPRPNSGRIFGWNLAKCSFGDQILRNRLAVHLAGTLPEFGRNLASQVVGGEGE